MTEQYLRINLNFSYNPLHSLKISLFSFSVVSLYETVQYLQIQMMHKDVHNWRIHYVLKTPHSSSKQRPAYKSANTKTTWDFMSSDHVQRDKFNMSSVWELTYPKGSRLNNVIGDTSPSQTDRPEAIRWIIGRVKQWFRQNEHLIPHLSCKTDNVFKTTS